MSIPPSMILELTYNCNHSCRFCSCPWLRHDFLYGEELSAEIWCRILDRLHALEVKNIQFTGGEPTLKKGFPEILQHAAKLSFQTVAVFSNGTSWDEEMLELFRKCGVLLSTSLPGFFSYRKLTNSPCSARELLEKVLLAREKGLDISVSITVTKQNLWELPFTVLIAAFHRATSIQIQSCAPEGRALQHLEMIPSDRQFKKIFQWAKFFNNILKIPVTFCYEQRCKCYDLDGNPSGIIPESCTAGKDFMVISPDGRMRKCLHAPESTENILTFLKKENP